jgi:hypothetical protein
MFLYCVKSKDSSTRVLRVSSPNPFSMVSIMYLTFRNALEKQALHAPLRTWYFHFLLPGNFRAGLVDLEQRFALGQHVGNPRNTVRLELAHAFEGCDGVK